MRGSSSVVKLTRAIDGTPSADVVIRSAKNLSFSAGWNMIQVLC